MRRTGPLVLLGVLACTALLAGSVRELNNVRIPVTANTTAADGWFCQDPDSLYHARRVARLLDEGLPVAERDPLLDTPRGARIPWPPYYTLVAGALLGPLAPAAGPARDTFLERGVASLPIWFGVATALVVAAAAWRLAGAGAAWIAGGLFALARASIDYSVPGVGDHHAWATLLIAAMFALAAAALGGLAARGLASGRPVAVAAPVALATLAGALGGLLVGSWVGGLVHVLIVELALGWALVVHARRGLPSLPAAGFAFHVALALVLAPAVFASPWKQDLPWMVVNLSWFHLALPLLGALIFVPPLVRGTTPRAYPWGVAAGLIVLGLLTAYSDLAFAGGVREGFAWAGRGNQFMAYITESQPLLWGQIGGTGVVTETLGWGAWIALPLWAFACWRAARSGELELLVWAIALPVMLVQALAQRRFAEALCVPLAVVVARGLVGLAASAERAGPSWARRLAVVGCLVAPFVLQWPLVRATAERVARGETNPGGPVVEDLRSFRALYTWLGAHAATRGDRGVLAVWDQGHAIEWVAGLPTVATNFGNYVGEDSYRDPMRCLLAEDPAEAEALLARRQARYVLLRGAFSEDLEVMLRLERPGQRSAFLAQRPGQVPVPTPRWYRTFAARLMLTGKVADPERGTLDGDSLDFVRLIHVSPTALRTPPAIPHTNRELPAGWIWERVAGARVTARGVPGERLEVQLEVEYPATGRRLRWSRTATVDAQGRAVVRVPYSSDAPNGDGRVVGQARWSLGERAGTLVIPEQAVQSGAEVQV